MPTSRARTSMSTPEKMDNSEWMMHRSEGLLAALPSSWMISTRCRAMESKPITQVALAATIVTDQVCSLGSLPESHSTCWEILKPALDNNSRSSGKKKYRMQ